MFTQGSKSADSSTQGQTAGAGGGSGEQFPAALSGARPARQVLLGDPFADPRAVVDRQAGVARLLGEAIEPEEQERSTRIARV